MTNFICNNKKIIGIIFFIFVIFTISMTTTAEIVIEGKLIREHSTQTGETYREYIQIKNNSSYPTHVKIYQTDYIFSHQGWSRYPEPAGYLERSNANWITFSPSLTIIPPHENATVNCTIKIPSNDSLIGTYWSMLMIEEMIPDDKTNTFISAETQVSDHTLALQQIMRYGIQLVSHIGNSGTEIIKILDQRLLSAAPLHPDTKNTEKRVGEYILQLDIENNGERLLRPTAWVDLYDLNGSFMGKFEGGKYIIYPGNSVRYKINLSNLSSQEYKALVVLDNGDENIWGSQFTLSL